MSSENFDAFFAFIERPDFDGQPLHTTQGDPGGATSWGWTFATYQGFARMHGLNTSFARFQAMKREDFIIPTRIVFWNGVQADLLPAGLDVIWADFQFGSYHATETLQRVIGAVPDNHVGPRTIQAAQEAVAGSGPADVIREFTEARKAYYKTLSTYSRFGGGWDRRADECGALALRITMPTPLS